jgi:hypothetical protein
MGSDITKEMRAMAKRDAKAFIREEARKDEIERKKREILHGEAKLRMHALIVEALQHGGNIHDPMYILCVCAEWEMRPLTRNGFVVLDDGHRRPAHRTVVGEILFSPMGGIRGLIVFDQLGDAMVMEGDCRRVCRWSRMTKNFHLVSKDEEKSIREGKYNPSSP